MMKQLFFLGPEGSYSHSITKQIFDEKKFEFVALPNFYDIVEKTSLTPDGVGVLPIENSITSDIHENIDQLFRSQLTISSEAFLRINLHLIGLPDATIHDLKEVYSHERALAQCSKFIKEHHLIVHPSQSTAAGKDTVLELHDKKYGVIGSKVLIEDRHLSIIQPNIGNDRHNMTRFVFVTKESIDITKRAKNKASVTFKVPHQPGSLAKLLNEIAQANINLTKIESRPIPGTDWEYQFWIDVERSHEALSSELLDKLFHKNTLSYKIVGIYPGGEIFES